MIKHVSLLAALVLSSGTALAAESTAKDEVIKAAKALGEKSSYAWVATVVVPEDAQFKPGPTDGQWEKGGALMVTQTFPQGKWVTIKQGDAVVLSNRDGGWNTAAEMESGEGFGRFRAAAARGLMGPAEDAVEIVNDVKELKKDGDVYSGELTEAGAKALMTFGGRRRGGAQGGPNIPFAKGSAKFWVKDGLLAKMEVKLDGAIEFNGNEMDVIRTTTTEIQDVGSAKVAIPEGAKSKMKP